MNMRVVARPRLGRELGNASAFAQVTGSGRQHAKIDRVFELVLLNSAPSRIRTSAHGSGGRLCP
jgi:hypothetical protein